jgi:hypothetical protein
LIRTHCKLHPPKEGKNGLPDLAKHILSRPIRTTFDFSPRQEQPKKGASVTRFPSNPGNSQIFWYIRAVSFVFLEPFWGPKRKAGRLKVNDSVQDNTEQRVEDLSVEVEESDVIEPSEKRLRTEE